MDHECRRKLLFDTCRDWLDLMERRNSISDGVLSYVARTGHFEERWMQVELGNLMRLRLEKAGQSELLPWLEWKREDIGVGTLHDKMPRWSVELKVTKHHSPSIPYLDLVFPATWPKYLLALSYHCTGRKGQVCWTDRGLYANADDFFRVVEEELNSHFPREKGFVLEEVDYRDYDVSDNRCLASLRLGIHLVYPSGIAA